jgi:hypothetical protein
MSKNNINALMLSVGVNFLSFKRSDRYKVSDGVIFRCRYSAAKLP